MTQIILNAGLQKIERDHRGSYKQAPDYFAQTMLSRLGKGHKFIGSDIPPGADIQLGFLETLSRAYSDHEKIEIAPHDIWYLVLSEIAIAIKKNPKICRSLFTRSEGQVEISVLVNDVTSIDLRAVVDKLKLLVPVDVNTFVPRLSNTPPDAEIAMYAALCDGVSDYYSYSTFCCGIPEIRLLGTPDDWLTLFESAQNIRAMFDSVGFTEGSVYMYRVAEVLNNIHRTFTTDTREFWQDIFTQRNVGSGGELEINGWIKELYYETRSNAKLNNFMVTNTIVKYKNLDTGRNFKGVYGGFERQRTADDFLKTSYSSLIFEVV